MDFALPAEEWTCAISLESIDVFENDLAASFGLLPVVCAFLGGRLCAPGGGRGSAQNSPPRSRQVRRQDPRFFDTLSIPVERERTKNFEKTEGEAGVGMVSSCERVHTEMLRLPLKMNVFKILLCSTRDL